MGTVPAQNPDTYCRHSKEFYDLLTSPGTKVTNLIFPNNKVAWVSCKYFEDNVATGKNVNVAVATYLTTQARLKLCECLSKLGKSVLYCDPDSFISIRMWVNPPKLKREIIWATSKMS